jgi:hypothetical protein
VTCLPTYCPWQQPRPELQRLNACTRLAAACQPARKKGEMTKDRVDECSLDVPARTGELLKLTLSEFRAQREAGLISRKQLSALNAAISEQYRYALRGVGIATENLFRALEKGLPVLKDGMEFYEAIDSMTPGELLDLRDAARSDGARRRKAREAGRQGGSAREGKRYSAQNHAYWQRLAAQRFATLSPWSAAIEVVNYLEGSRPRGDAPKVRTVYPVLRKEQSWRSQAKPKNR